MTITVDYAGKLVLITGGGRGIGLAISTAMAKGVSLDWLTKLMLTWHTFAYFISQPELM